MIFGRAGSNAECVNEVAGWAGPATALVDACALAARRSHEQPLHSARIPAIQQPDAGLTPSQEVALTEPRVHAPPSSWRMQVLEA
jgi:hypothetical protein